MASRSGYVTVNGLQTHVITFGGWVEDANRLPDKRVIICIPGNPGLTGYYTTFLSTLYAKTNIPCWIASHAGHELTSKSREKPAENQHNYTVQGQTAHKIAFIEKYVPSDVRITLIGHSIGAKIISDILKTSRIETQVDNGFLLFPTIERMATTPNGKFLLGTIKPFVFLIVCASWFFYILPNVLKKFLISLWLMFDGCSTDMAEVTVRLVRPRILRNVFSMAMDEMEVVTTVDAETLRKNARRLVLYYGANDNWAPVDYCLALKTSVPALDVRVCEKGYGHAFVLNSSVPVANMVAEWIGQK